VKPQILLASGMLWLIQVISSPAWGALERQPYLQNVTDSQVVLRWRSDMPTDSVVHYGVQLENLNRTVSISGATTEHEVVVSGLNADTRYYYSVGSSAGTEAGGDAWHYFRTAPMTGSNRRLRIWAIGDSGTGRTGQLQVRNAYYNLDSMETDIVLALGDNAYDNGTDNEYTANFFGVYQDLFRHTPVWSAIGNHERNSGAYTTAFSHPTQGEGGGQPSGTELYYSFDYGNVHFVALDSFTDNLNSDAMYLWLEDDLSSTTQKWIIAYWHHPPYSRSSTHDSDSETGMKVLRERANPILERYGVDLQLSGHNHFYSRTYLINGHYGQSSSWNASTHAVDSGDGREDGDGVYDKQDQAKGAVYILAGSSGKQGYTIYSHPANFIEVGELGSMVIDIAGDRMDVRMLRENGSIDDYFTIVKGAANGVGNGGGGGDSGNPDDGDAGTGDNGAGSLTVCMLLATLSLLLLRTGTGLLNRQGT